MQVDDSTKKIIIGHAVLPLKNESLATTGKIGSMKKLFSALRVGSPKGKPHYPNSETGKEKKIGNLHLHPPKPDSIPLADQLAAKECLQDTRDSSLPKDGDCDEKKEVAKPAPSTVSSTGKIVFEKNEEEIEKEFASLPEFSGEKSEATFDEGNKHRRSNRYINVLPNDGSRFAIQADPEFYYNANSVLNGCAIAAQGPRSQDQEAFWQMVGASGATIIIMLTNCKEWKKGAFVEKCSQYWPDVGKSLDFKCGRITCLSEKWVCSPKKKNGEYIVERKFLFKTSSGTREISQLHLINWGDFEPIDPHILNTAVKWTYQRMVPEIPIVVHCTAGVGRTGTFLAVLDVYDKLVGQEPVDIRETVVALRDPLKGRCGMVQTLDQYKTIYAASNQLYSDESPS